jgi:hypothetical protein
LPTVVSTPRLGSDGKTVRSAVNFSGERRRRDNFHEHRFIRFLDFATRQVMKAWTARQEQGVIPFTPLAKPLRECTIALVSTAGIACNDDPPFNQEHERRDPWWGDPSFRARRTPGRIVQQNDARRDGRAVDGGGLEIVSVGFLRFAIFPANSARDGR